MIASLRTYRTRLALLGIVLALFGAGAVYILASFAEYRAAAARAQGTRDAPVAVQLERGYRQMLTVLDLYRLGDRGTSRDTLRAQFDVFARGVPGVLAATRTGALRDHPEILAALEALHAALPEHAAVLATGDRAAAERMRAQLASYADPIAALVQESLLHAADDFAAQQESFGLLLNLFLASAILCAGLLTLLLLIEMSRSERRATFLRTVLDNMDQAVNVFDRDGRLILMNRRSVELFEVPPALTQVGTSFDDILRHLAARGEYGPIPAGGIDEILARRRRILEDPNPRIHRRTRPNGIVLEARGRALPDGGSLATYTDITANQRAERELERAMRAAEDANRAKSEFLASMSHELRTPLNAIIGFSDIMAKAMFGPLDPRYRDYARDVHNSGTHLLELINDILDLAKIESGKLEMHEDSVDLRDVIGFAVRAVEALRNKSGATITTEIANDAPAVLADTRMMKQICVNILSNAVKFTPEGGRVTITLGRDPAGNVELVVRDTGVGIAPENLDRIFEPFVTVENSYSRKYAGTGLGLPLTRELVALHGGLISITSRAGDGTTVSVMLPAARVLNPAHGVSS